jgi:alkylation response protein AidB-like acyl-CoA dehydrogenase
MDFSFTEEQCDLRRATLDFAQRELSPGIQERDRAGEFHHEGWRRAGEFGLLGLSIGQKYGGLGGDAVTLAGALESLGYGCLDNGLSFSICAHLLAVAMPILEIGTEQQKRRYLPGMASGKSIGANAASEPDAGSDVFGLRTRAVRDAGGYVLTGSKIFTTNAPVADVFLVLANVDSDRRKSGVTAFLVDRDTPGLRLGASTDKMGLRTSPMSEVYFDECRVGEEARLGREGAGGMLFTTAMIWERAFILASAVGSMRRLLDQCVQYAKARKQGGQAIGKYQMVASRIVDMKLRLETAQGLLYRTAWLKANGDNCFAEAALTKLYLSESWLAQAHDALHLFGGYGYTEEYDYAREVRDATGSRIYSGTSEIQRIIVAGMLGL